ncbi:hypothetical protein [Vibrio ouci]|uniref:Uncharacterized protein n=1 Tax=Vibrio ouci TaxID=2499078 RepID=A0A4Y8WHY6_9VIBR|nr:hypothetical protein [Vibrio ouci]TFH92195.1 hypothetical protein ELS82_07205 [Vibrio ouci]
MNKLKQIFKDLVATTRRQWLAEMVYKYGVRTPSTWSTLGYGSKAEFEQDLRQSVKEDDKQTAVSSSL